jgi:hypothetical protein
MKSFISNDIVCHPDRIFAVVDTDDARNCMDPCGMTIALNL